MLSPVARCPYGRRKRPGRAAERTARDPPSRSGLQALPGGFIDHGEDWRHAVVGELREETGIGAEPSEVRLADVLGSPGGHLLVFGLPPERPIDEPPPFVPAEETDGRQMLPVADELAFPLQTEVARG